MTSPTVPSIDVQSTPQEAPSAEASQARETRPVVLRPRRFLTFLALLLLAPSTYLVWLAVTVTTPGFFVDTQSQEIALRSAAGGGAVLALLALLFPARWGWIPGILSGAVALGALAWVVNVWWTSGFGVTVRYEPGPGALLGGAGALLVLYASLRRAVEFAASLRAPA